MHTDEDRKATQAFVFLNELVPHCGARLTNDLIDRIVRSMIREADRGPCAWAFKGEEKPSGSADL